MLTSLDHAIVAVRDLEAAARDTRALLGRAPTWRGVHPGAGTANTLFRLTNTTLELLAPEGPGPVGDLLRARLAASDGGEGLLGLAFATDDADACAALLRERGLDPEPPRAGLGRDEDSGAMRRWRNVHLPLARTRGLVLFAIERRSPPEVLTPAPTQGDERAAVAALDHVVVLSSDLDEARRLYGDGLGLRLALDRGFEARGLRMLFFRVGGVTVEVVGRLGAAAPDAPGTDPPADRTRDRFGGLAWRVPDADAARERLVREGFDISAVRAGHKPGTRVLGVRDRTCGVPTLLVEPAA